MLHKVTNPETVAALREHREDRDTLLASLTSSLQANLFIDPHGIGREPLTGAKIQLHSRLRNDIAPRLREQHPDINLHLDAFILAPTHAADRTIPIIVDNTPEDLAANHILFQSDEKYIEKLFAALEPA